MPETVSIDDQNGIILIDSRNQVGEDDLAKSIESVLQIVHTRGLHKVMVDATGLASLPPTASLHRFASELSRRASGLKHALVVGKQSLEDMTFIETVALNRGASIRLFSSREDAVSWLKE